MTARRSSDWGADRTTRRQIAKAGFPIEILHRIRYRPGEGYLRAIFKISGKGHVAYYEIDLQEDENLTGKRLEMHLLANLHRALHIDSVEIRA